MFSDDDLKFAREHRDVLLHLRVVLNTNEGREVFKYLFKHLEVGNLPQPGMEPIEQADVLGKLRAGNSIFKMVSEANHIVAGDLLAKIEKERYDELYAEYQKQERNVDGR
jgi:hypothetical protein